MDGDESVNYRTVREYLSNDDALVQKIYDARLALTGELTPEQRELQERQLDAILSRAEPRHMTAYMQLVLEASAVKRAAHEEQWIQERYRQAKVRTQESLDTYLGKGR